MTRARSIAAVVAGALAWAATSACNQQTIQTPLRSFDRPSDVALTCAQYFPDPNVVNLRPLGDCTPDNAAALVQKPSYILPPAFFQPLGPNPFTPFVMALVTQSARGELAVVDGAQNRLVDLDPLKPGFGFVPVGRLPEHVRASSDGCKAVTSNTDSCDFGVVDLSTVIRNSLLAQTPADMGGSRAAVDLADGVKRMQATLPAAGGGLRALSARPAWIEMAVDGTPAIHGYEDGGTPGQCSGGVHKVWAAFPGCQLVVKMRIDGDDSKPNVEAAIQVSPTGARVVTDLTTLSCPVECAGAPLDMGGAAAPTDLAFGPAAPSDMGNNLPATQSYPGTLAVDAEGGRLVIGDLYGERVDIVPMDATGALGAPRALRLETGAGGVRVVRVAPRSVAGKFLYAIARDGTVRVVDLDREVECETNPDPRFAGAKFNLQQTPQSTPPLENDPNPRARVLGCFPLGDPSTPPRSPLATTPGITLAAGQLPADVAFVRGSVPPISSTSSAVPPSAGPGLLVGDFAWIVSSDGRATLVDIYDACPAPNQQDVARTAPPYTPTCDPGNVDLSIKQTLEQFGHPQAMLLDRVSHRIRPGHARFAAPQSAGDSNGQPRVLDEQAPCAVAVPPTSPGSPDGGIPDAGAGVCGGNASLPSFYAERLPPDFYSSMYNPSHADTVPTRIVRFVDPDRTRNETWVASWEGTLPGTDRSVGAAKRGGFFVDAGGQWCTRGVLAGDKLILRGCGDDSECDQAGGFRCIHDPSAFADVSTGMCLPIDNKTLTPDFWSGQCGKLLRAQRKFRITSARQGAVPPWDPSSPPLDYLALAEIYEPEFAEQTHGCDNKMKGNQPDDALCADVQIAAAVGGAIKATSCLPDWDGVDRCLLRCSTDQDCGPDFECAKSKLGDMRCMRAPLDDELWFTNKCVPELQQYEIHVGDAFLIGGTASGILLSGSVDKMGECKRPDPTSSYAIERQSRVPLTPVDDKSNPLVCPPPVGPSTPMAADYSPLESLPSSARSNVCSIDTAGLRILHYQNPILNFALQIPKPGMAYPTVIVPPDGTSVSMQLTGGGGAFSIPLGIDVQAQQPRFIAVAPDQQTLYIVDEGKSISAVGLRGQLLRLFTPSQSLDHQFVVR